MPAEVWLLLAAVAVVASPALLLVRDARITVAPSTAAARAVRHATMPAAVATAVLLLALVAAAAVMLVGSRQWPGGRAVVSAPLAAGALALGVYALGERTFPRPEGAIRTASLTSRSVADVAPRYLVRAVITWAGVLAVLLVTGVLTATGPRHLDRTIDGWISRGEPYPGTWFAVPLAVVGAVVLVLTWLTLRLVATRPAVGGVDDAWDLALRRSTAARVLRGVQLAFAFTVAGVLLMTAWALHSAGAPMPRLGPDSASDSYVTAGSVVFVLAQAAWVTGVALAARRGAPRPSARRSADLAVAA